MKPSSRRAALYRKLKKMFLVEFLEALFAAVLVAVVIRTFLIGFYRVPTESMMPTLLPGDFIVANKTAFGISVPFFSNRFSPREPERGDVVVFELADDNAIYIKRVVAVSGDRVEIRAGLLYVNEVQSSRSRTENDEWILSEELAGDSTHRVMRRKASEEPDFLAPVVVPPGHVFLLGDLRTDSFDSRHWGPVPMSRILARAAFVAFSLEVDEHAAPSSRVRTERVFKSIE